MKQEIQDLVGKLGIIEEAIEDAEEHALEVLAVADKDDREDVAECLKILKGLLDRVKYVAGALDPIIIKNATRDDSVVLIPSGGSVEATWSKPRKTWQHDKIAPVVVEKIIDSFIDEDSGAISVPPSQLMLEILKYAHVDYWRVKKLTDLEINPDLYSQVGETKSSIIVR